MSDINRLAKEYFDASMAANPTEAHLLGQYRHAARFEDPSRAEEDRRIAELRDFAARAEAIDPAALNENDRLTREVMIADAGATADLLGARLSEVGADPIFGPQVELPIVAGMLAVPDAEVAEAMVSKYRAVGEAYRALAARQREGVVAGRVSAAFAVADTIEQLDAILAGPPAEDPMLATAPLPADVDAEAWRAAMVEAIATSIRPGMAEFRDALRDDVAPIARPDENVGLCWLPDGEADYDRTLRYFTTTTKSAQEIHDIGLEQIARLAEEYRELGPQVVGTDDLDAIFEAMRTDPALHFETGEQLVDQSEIAMQRAWEAMGDWFEVLPQARCEVQATMTGAKAFYFPPATDGSRGGTFFINVDDPSSWGTFELESMAFHEGIPGHHLQLTIASELTDVPEFRKHLFNSAYGEGWGLYSERLADEMGLYSGPVDRMGMFAADSMRACRLVVDTGMHALGWSRQQAIDYMLANSPLAAGIVVPEIDRYIVSPGQATSYMIGRLEILRMRDQAQARQGEAFDIRRFHSAVLDAGSLPLGVLDRVVAARLP